MIARATVIAGVLGGVSLLLPGYSQTSLNLAWDPSADEVQGYKLYSIITSTGQAAISELGPTTVAAVNNLAPGQTYRFYVTAYTTNNVESDPSNAIEFTVPADGSGSGTTNRPPTLQPIPNQFADEGRPMQIALQASDPDPGQTLRYSLGTNVPSGATINTNTGVFTWTPTAAQAPSTNQITLIATDSGSPAMSASQTFTVVVRPGAMLAISTAGTANLVKGSVAVNPRGTLNPEGTKYIYGTSVTATATPQSGAYFAYWEHNGGRYTQNPITFAMTGNQSLTAYFGIGGIKPPTTLSTTETTLATTSKTTDTTTTTTALGAAATTETGTATSDDTNVYVLEASTNLVEWTAVTNVVATTNQVDTNAVFRIRPATE